MVDRKNQHFVPRALLRPWTKNGANKSISLFNHRSGRGIPAAPVKNQCSRDYFYGRDLRLETWLGRGEGMFADAVRYLPTTDISQSAASLEILRDFAYLQSIRTERSLAEEAALLLSLGVERVERLVEPFLGRLPRIDGAAPPRRTAHRTFACRRPKQRGPFQRIPVIWRATSERLPQVLPS